MWHQDIIAYHMHITIYIYSLMYIYLHFVARDYTAMVFVAQNYPSEVRSGRIFVSYAQVLGRVDVRSRPT